MGVMEEQLDAAAKAELDEHGMTIIEDLLTPEQTARALAALQRLFEDGHAEDQHKDIYYTMNLTARDEIFREVVTLPRLVSLEAHLLGDDYILSDVVSLTPLPGNEPQNLHRDGGNIDHIIACETSKPILEYWLCRGALSVRSAIGSHVDFDAQNGPTRFVRGSHLRPHVGTWSRTKGPSKPGSTQHIQEGESGEDEEIFVGRAGSALLYDNRLVHGRGPNRAVHPRYTMSLFCCRSWVKPFTDHTRSIPPQLVRDASPLLRRLWGFESQPAFEDWHQRRPLNSGRNMKIVAAEGAKPRGPFGAVEQVEWRGLPRL